MVPRALLYPALGFPVLHTVPRAVLYIASGFPVLQTIPHATLYLASGFPVLHGPSRFSLPRDSPSPRPLTLPSTQPWDFPL
jgi:hypothetical protein